MSDEVYSKSGDESEWRGSTNVAPGLQIRVAPGHTLSDCIGTVMWVREDVMSVEVDLKSSSELELPSYLKDIPDLCCYYLFHVSQVEILE